MRWDDWGEKHWLKQENSHYSSPVQGGHVPLGTDWLALLLVRISIRHQLHHLVSISQKTNFLRLMFSLLSQWGSVVILDMLWVVVQILLPCSDFPFVLLNLGLLFRRHLIQKTTINCPCYCNFLRTQQKMNKYRAEINSKVIVLSSFYSYR